MDEIKAKTLDRYLIVICTLLRNFWYFWYNSFQLRVPMIKLLHFSLMLH